ncbi:jg24127 [Pararge aegeria aegeria]|uniref:Jg24127 protein n=1 Tax=Pararge aegeria aegeria TaxID=348720 RepID=A0A8S4RK58_9NEOP|nr:jg24127 [Pararge aegeria aegeria]
MSYASVAFAFPPSAYKRFQSLQNRFMRNATGCPWFVRNVDLHRDLKLPTIAQYFKKLSKIYFEKSIRHPNPLIVAASFYSPNLSATLNKRRPKHILHDPDDQITIDNVSEHTINLCTASSPAKTRSPTSNVNRTWARTKFSEACGLITVRNPFTSIVA